MKRYALLLLVAELLIVPPALAQDADSSKTRLALVQGTGDSTIVAVMSREQKGMAVFLWFYEWNLFDAVNKGETTQAGSRQPPPKEIDKAQTSVVVGAPELQLSMKAAKGGADLSLKVTNKSKHDWPQIAGIIPCFNPGRGAGLNPEFANEKTWFVGPKGLEPLRKREIHFNDKLRGAVDAVSRQDRFGFSDKWPTAEPNARAGVLIRESNDGRWVTGIAWEDYVSVQGHNPFQCMHLSVHVGPLKQGETKTVQGRIYLFKGTKEDCFKQYARDFKVDAPR